MWMKTKKLKKFERVLTKKLKLLMEAKKFEYGKDIQKIRFESNDDLPLKNPIKLRLLTIIIRSVFNEGSKFYPQFFLDDALYELSKFYGIKKLMFQKKLT